MHTVISMDYCRADWVIYRPILFNVGKLYIGPYIVGLYANKHMPIMQNTVKIDNWRRLKTIGVPDRGPGGQSPPWISETSKIRADGMGNSGIQGTEFF